MNHTLTMYHIFRDVVHAKKIQVPEGGEPGCKDKFENVTTTVKREETFVPFDRILNIKKLPKEAETYYLLQSECFLLL